MDIMDMFSELVDELVRYRRIENLQHIKAQLEADIQSIGFEERLMKKYNRVLLAIEEVVQSSENTEQLIKPEDRPEKTK